MDRENDLRNRFSFHPADTDEKARAHEGIRQLCLDLSFRIDDIVPDGREKSLAITHLEEVMMWSNAGIARAR